MADCRSMMSSVVQAAVEFTMAYLGCKCCIVEYRPQHSKDLIAFRRFVWWRYDRVTVKRILLSSSKVSSDEYA